VSATSELADALGGPVPKIAGLTAAQARRLAALVEDATARQAASLDRAIEGGLSHIPRLLRGAVKSVLFR
jgi:hypothetical protein